MPKDTPGESADKPVAHTPGPWEIGRYGITGREVVGDGLAVAVLGKRVFSNKVDVDAEVEANARLIAAAPDLLAACKHIAAMAVAWEALTPGDIEEVRAAIRKAEGARARAEAAGGGR